MLICKTYFAVTWYIATIFSTTLVLNFIFEFVICCMHYFMKILRYYNF